MTFTLLIAAFVIILMAIVLFTLFGVIGRGVEEVEENHDGEVIADSRDADD